MALTKDFRLTVRDRALTDAKFRKALLREGLELIYAGDFAVGKAILRDYINATVGFQELSLATGIPSASLQRMFGPSGNPRAENLCLVIAYLQKQERVSVDLRLRPAA